MAFEGIEGAGKSTQLARVAENLSRLGVRPVVAREPGGTAVGESIREVVLDGRRRMDAVTEALLIVAARAAFVEEVITPALDSGRIVLSDRYALSTLAYQGGGRGLSMAHLRELNEFATRGVRPDVYLLFDVDPTQGLGRRGSRAADRIESEDLAFHGRVAECYRSLAATDRGVAVIDARGDVDAVFVATWAELSRRFPETFITGKG